MNQNQKVVPLFLFNGFLDSGKTTLIKEIIEGEKAYHSPQTLILSFEDGEVSYDDEWLKKYKVSYKLVTDEELENENIFFEIYQNYKPTQIVMELNAFVDFSNLRFPKIFEVFQEITIFDANKFELYFNNMKPLINQMVNYASLVVFNRCGESNNLSKFRRNIRAFNQQTQVAFETSDGKLTTILDEDLPYDINSDKIILEDKHFPIWYLDVTECFDKYQNKEIEFCGYVRDINDKTIIVGRQIMTCCVDDIQFYGFECFTNQKIELNSLVKITCEITKEYSAIAEAKVIMLRASKIEVLDYVDEEALTFE